MREILDYDDARDRWHGVSLDRDIEFEAKFGSIPLVSPTHTLRYDQWLYKREGYRAAWDNRTAVIDGLKAENARLLDAGCDKIIAMTEEQINALCRLEGHDPKDEATISKQCCEIVLLKTENATLRSQVKMLRDALTHMCYTCTADDGYDGNLVEKALAATKEGS